MSRTDHHREIVHIDDPGERDAAPWGGILLFKGYPPHIVRINGREDAWARRVTRRGDRHEAKALIRAGRYDDLRTTSKPGTSGWMTW